MENKRQELKRRVAAFVGEWNIAKRAFDKKKAKNDKKYSNEFADALARIKPLCHHSINTCSILTWHEIMKTGNYSLLLKEPRELTEIEANAINKIYADMRNELIKSFGWGEKKIVEMELILEIVNRNRKLQADGDVTQYTWIKIAEERLRDIWNEYKLDDEESNIIEYAISLESVLKISIKVNECSVAMFYGYIKLANKLSQKEAA